MSRTLPVTVKTMLRSFAGVRPRPLRVSRAALREMISELGIDDAASVAALCALLSQQRGRPIIRCPVENLAPHASGIWVETVDADYIFYEAAANAAHAEHIILHELGHLIRAHQGSHDDAAHDWLAALGAPPPNAVRCRTTYSDVQEVEAELAAYVLRRTLDCNRSRAPGVKARCGRYLGHWRQRIAAFSAFQRLRPLWKALVQAVPGVLLDAAVTERPDLFAIRDLEFWMHRRLVEIRDAQLAMRWYLDAPGAVQDQPGQQQRIEAAAVAEAARLARAISVVGVTGQPGAAAASVPARACTPDSCGAGVDELTWLTEVARAFSVLHRGKPL